MTREFLVFAGALAAGCGAATGGHPPYTFAWSDGTASATREIGPAMSTSYRVTVTDTADRKKPFVRDLSV